MCIAYLLWLQNSEQGKELVKEESFHATALYLQVFAIAAFLGDTYAMYKTVLRPISRAPVVNVSGKGRAAQVQLRLWDRLRVLVAKTFCYDFSDFSQWRLSESVGCLVERLQLISPEQHEESGLYPGMQLDDSDEAVPPFLKFS